MSFKVKGNVTQGDAALVLEAMLLQGTGHQRASAIPSTGLRLARSGGDHLPPSPTNALSAGRCSAVVTR